MHMVLMFIVSFSLTNKRYAVYSMSFWNALNAQVIIETNQRRTLELKKCPDTVCLFIYQEYQELDSEKITINYDTDKTLGL